MVNGPLSAHWINQTEQLELARKEEFLHGIEHDLPKQHPSSPDLRMRMTNPWPVHRKITSVQAGPVSIAIKELPTHTYILEIVSIGKFTLKPLLQPSQQD